MLTSVIKTNPLGKWYIELTDENNEENVAICLDIEEYAQKVEQMGQEAGYGPDVQVTWSSDDNVSPIQINEVRQQIMAYEARIEAEKQNDTHQPDGMPNFQG